MHISGKRKIGIGLGLLALGGGGAIMIAPEQLLIGWGMIALAVAGAVALLAHHFQKFIKETPVLVLVGTGLIIAGGVVGLVGAMRMDAARHPPEGPLRVQAISFPFDHADGVRTAGIIWQKGYARTELMLHNSLGEVISDLDVIFRPEFPLIKSSAISAFAKCQIGPVGMPPAPIILGTGPDGKTSVAADDGPEDMNTYIVPAHRLYCDKLAAKTEIRVVLATVVSTNDVMGPMFQERRKDPGFVDVFLKYLVRSEKHEEQFRLTFAR